MRKFRSLMVAAIGILTLAVMASSASAGGPITVNDDEFTATASKTLTLDPDGLAIVCDLSFDVALTSTSFPSSPATVGSVDGSGGNCDGGVGLTLLNLPWTLSAATSGGPGDVTANTVLTIENAQFLVLIGSLSCLYQGDVEGTISGGSTLEITDSVPPNPGNIFLCPANGELRGTFDVSPAIRITLS